MADEIIITIDGVDIKTQPGKMVLEAAILPDDLDLMRNIGLNMQAGSLCGHGQLGFNPVSSAIKYFAPEFEAHIIDRRCPTGSCANPKYSPHQTRR